MSSCLSEENTRRPSVSVTSTSVSCLSYVYFSQSANGLTNKRPKVRQYKTTLSSPHHANPRGLTRQLVFLLVTFSWKSRSNTSNQPSLLKHAM